MTRTFATSVAGALLMSASIVATAAGYNDPGGDKLYTRCLTEASNLYDGGQEKSPIRGQSKLVAWCTCMWNETPDDFKGSLVKFAESSRGKSTNKICEKHSDWRE